MASIFATLPPPLLAPGKSFTPLFTYQRKLTVFPIAKGRSANGIVKAIGDSSESSTSIDIIKSVRNVAVDKLPLLPGVLEFIGILVSWWFVYRYLLFKPNREELLQIINKSVADVLGQ
ncbi:Protein CURVATURE THYLAKOID 1C, chloroplastic [Cucurbita argyrosperma subsp. argyrosperma]|nr:Protein CURVATURE THYLAKOID 1C, chloroplastic [Cucurbita argyrosperma subsp. argyrosperma]